MKKYDRNYLADLSALFDVLPPILFRNNPKFQELTGMSPRSLANMDCRGGGPTERVIVGRVVGYPRKSLIEWLESRSRIIS
jgi:hypothetical protein